MERSKDWLDEARGDLEHARNDPNAHPSGSPEADTQKKKRGG